MNDNTKRANATFIEKDGKFIVTPVKPTVSDILKQHEEGLIDDEYCKMLIAEILLPTSVMLKKFNG